MTTISGIMPLRRAVALGYPFEMAIRSLRLFCDEVVVAVDPTSGDGTVERVRALGVDRVVESVWDASNTVGGSEITKQTRVAYDASLGDWVLSLQADEVLHERDVATVRSAVYSAERTGVDALEFFRIYFFGTLDRVRTNWSLWIARLARRGRWLPGNDGMVLRPATSEPKCIRLPRDAAIYHYSRIGDPAAIAERVRTLDMMFHPKDRVAASAPPYDFGLRKLDTYVVGAPQETDPIASVEHFDPSRHPAEALTHFAEFIR